MSEEAVKYVNDQIIKTEPPEDVELEVEEKLVVLDNEIIKYESCSNIEGDGIRLERFIKSEVINEEEVKQELINYDISNGSFPKSFGLKECLVVVERLPSPNKESPITCKICHKTCKQSNGLTRHMKAMHSGERREFKCNICKKTFTYLCHFNSHMMIHSGVRPHECTICDKTFTTLSNLNSHLLIHNKVRPHKCTICNKAFNYLNSLKRHLPVHSRESHECTICNKIFFRLTNLKKHLLIHSDERPHKCSICGMAFRHRCVLKRHLLVHSNKYPYECDICNKKFKQSHHLKRHNCK
ncbi:zinc finger protein 98-like [Ctenocephalides felis]|uniref:zinc finger protein 98-like n=1 Tax=Ctenocephalides felis TaxID=7515 RepID=UPI000E6E5504|nr:zinc finger protein 98-like [Ctenocephalides felis]